MSSPEGTSPASAVEAAEYACGYESRCAHLMRALMTTNQAFELVFPLCCKRFHAVAGSGSSLQLLTQLFANQILSSIGNQVSFSFQSMAVGRRRIVLAKTSNSQMTHQARRFSSSGERLGWMRLFGETLSTRWS